MAPLPVRPPSPSYERAAELHGRIRQNAGFRGEDHALQANRMFQIHQALCRIRGHGGKEVDFSEAHAVGHVFLIRHLLHRLSADSKLDLTREEKANLESLLGWTWGEPSLEELKTRIASVDWFRDNEDRGDKIYARLQEEIAHLGRENETFIREHDRMARALEQATHTLFSNPLTRWSLHPTLGRLKQSLAARKQGIEERVRKEKKD